MPPLFQLTDAWKDAFPKAHAGVLAIDNAENHARHPDLQSAKTRLQQRLRARWQDHDRDAMAQDPVLQAYQDYYRNFKKTYHVQLQLESVVHKQKPLPTVSTLVDAMFMAELDHLLLTAGHDLDTLQLPLRLHVSQGHETYTTLRGKSQTLKGGDMFIADGQGIISNIIYGPDRRTRITPTTRNVIYTTYAPAGVPPHTVQQHLTAIQDYILSTAPQAQVRLSHLFPTPNPNL